jgi:hypothetical protein
MVDGRRAATRTTEVRSNAHSLESTHVPDDPRWPDQVESDFLRDSSPNAVPRTTAPVHAVAATRAAAILAFAGPVPSGLRIDRVHCARPAERPRGNDHTRSTVTICCPALRAYSHGSLRLQGIRPAQSRKACEVAVSRAQNESVLDGENRQVSVRHEVRMDARQRQEFTE